MILFVLRDVMAIRLKHAGRPQRHIVSGKKCPGIIIRERIRKAARFEHVGRELEELLLALRRPLTVRDNHVGVGLTLLLGPAMPVWSGRGDSGASASATVARARARATKRNTCKRRRCESDIMINRILRPMLLSPCV